MYVIGTAALALATFVACVALASSTRRRPLALLLPAGIAIMVAVEAVIACGLSWVRAFERGPVVAAHVAFIVVVTAALGRSKRLRVDLARVRRLPTVLRRWDAAVFALTVGTLAIAFAVVALAYAPSNWDTMTYRLARVAHWIQNRSVEPYATSVRRQVFLPPGAEYVLATWQVMSGSDRLANFLQLASWLAVTLAAAPLVRLAGGSRRIASVAAIVAACAPMAVLQATSTQTDLVAAAIAIAVVVATVPFLHRTPRFRAADGALLGATVVAAYLTKPSAVVACFPVLVTAAVVSLRAIRASAAWGRGARAAAAALAVAATAALPDASLRLSDPVGRAEGRAAAAPYVYPLFGELADRGANLVRGVVRHFPAPVFARQALGMSDRCEATTAITCESTEGLAHEDYAGNPLQAVIAMALVVLAAFRWRSLQRRSRATVALVVCSWMLFQVTFRSNPWVSRLETPTYALGALLFVAVPSKRPRRRLGEFTGAMVALIAVIGGIRVAIRNESRPLWPAVSRPYPVDDYYVNRRPQRVLDDTALWASLRWSCPRLGMYIGEDSYDYPLTWRAMSLGIETRHVSPGDPWPCLVATDGTVPLPLDAPWEQLGATMVFRNLAGLGDRESAASRR